MKFEMVTTCSPSRLHFLDRTNLGRLHNPNPVLNAASTSSSIRFSVNFSFVKPSRSWPVLCSSNGPNSSHAETELKMNRMEEKWDAERAVEYEKPRQDQWRVQVGNPIFPSWIPTTKLSTSDQAFCLMAFIACSTSVAFLSLVIAAVPTLNAMGRAALSLSKLADTAREELPSTMAAIRLSGMEISDLTLELSDLSQEISDGVSKSAQAVQAAEAGIRQMGSIAREQTMSIIEERANLPPISLQPIVVGAAKKTSRAVGQATKSFLNMLSGGDLTLGDDESE
ncbi:hypothetical protein NMG60_11035860 [Bertholletia excelsa]